jgi:sirohydrochlorin ferrochelatase
MNPDAQTALLIVAHGSRRGVSNDEVRALTRDIERQSGGRYRAVGCAFLELAEPSIPDGLRDLIDCGARHIIVVPYFLSAGRHVAEDIPGEVDLVLGQYPDIDIRIAPYLGLAAGIPGLILGQADAL